MTPEQRVQCDKEQAIAQNDAWHLRNIEQYLRPCTQACQQNNSIGMHKAWGEYAAHESQRLLARAVLMEQYALDRLPHTHHDQEHVLLQQARAYITANIETGRAAR